MIDLSAPRVVTFVISVVIALIAVVIHYSHVANPHVHSGFVVLLVGYLVLAPAICSARFARSRLK